MLRVAFLKQRREKEKEFAKVPTASLVRTLTAHGLKGKSGGRSAMLDLILSRGLEIVGAFEPDADQTKLLARLDEPDLIVNAGAGSGKTTTLGAFAVALNHKHPDVPVLLVAFNIVAESALYKAVALAGGRVGCSLFARSELVCAGRQVAPETRSLEARPGLARAHA